MFPVSAREMWLPTGILLACIFCTAALSNTLDSIYHQNYYRKYIIHKPTGFTDSSELPVVMVLHGGSGSAASTINFSQMDRVADSAGFLAVFPQGYTPSAMRGFVWADGRNGVADKAGIDDVGFISALIDTLDSQMSIDKSRIYVTGISNGGFMTARLACEISDRLASVAIVCATFDFDYFPTCAPSTKIPLMLMMGTDDPLVPYEGGRMSSSGRDIIHSDSLISFWLNQNACSAAVDSFSYPDSILDDNSTVTRYEYRNCSCNATVALYKIFGGGHTWAGVENKTYETIAGETNEDIHAGEEIWKFFKPHRLGCNETDVDFSRNTHKRNQHLSPGLSDVTEMSTHFTWYDLRGRSIGSASLKVSSRSKLNQMPSGVSVLSMHAKQNDEFGQLTVRSKYVHNRKK